MISTEVNQKLYSGNGLATVFSYNFKIFAKADLEVIVADEDDTQTTLVLDTHYTVSGAGEDTGGNVTLLDLTSITGAEKLPTGWKVSIRRILDILQETDFNNQGGFFPETHEDQFDKVVSILQQLQTDVARCPKVSETSGLTGDSYLESIEDTIADGVAEIEGIISAGQDAINNTLGLAEDARDAALVVQGLVETAQGLAETAQGLSEDARDASQGYASDASDSADAAAASVAAAGLPASVAGHGGDILRVKGDESGYEFDSNITPAIAPGDANKIIMVKNDETGYELVNRGREIISNGYLGNAGFPIFNKEVAQYPAITDLWGTDKHLWLLNASASGNISDLNTTTPKNLTLTGTLKKSRNFKNDANVYNTLDGASFLENSNVDTGTGSFCFGALIDFNSLRLGTEQSIASRYRTDTNSYRSWQLLFLSTNILYFAVKYNTTDGTVDLSISGLDKLSGKHFVECFYDQTNTKIRVYIDGVLVGETLNASLSTRNNNASSRFLIGARAVATATQEDINAGINIDLAYYSDAIPTEAQHQALVAKILGYTYNSGTDKINEMGKDYTRILAQSDLDALADYSKGELAWAWIMDSATADAVGADYAGTKLANTGNTAVALKVRNAVLKQSRHLDGTLKYNFFNGSQRLEISSSESSAICTATPKSFIMAINLRTLFNPTVSEDGVIGFSNANGGSYLVFHSSTLELYFVSYFTSSTNEKIGITKLSALKGKDVWLFMGHSLEEQTMFMKLDNQSARTFASSNLKTSYRSSDQLFNIGNFYNGSNAYLEQAQIKQALLIYKPFRLADIEPICEFIMAGKMSHSYGQVLNYGQIQAKVTDKDGNVRQEILENIVVKSENNAVYYNIADCLEQSEKIQIEVK